MLIVTYALTNFLLYRIHAKASQPSAGIDLLSRLNGLKVNAAPVATTAAPASAPVTSPVPSASASKLLSVLKSPATTTGTAAASSSSSTAPSIQKPAATTSPSAAPSSYLQALRGEQSPVTPPVTTSASSSASTAVKTPAAISATIESVPAAAAPAATATATKTPVKVPVSRLFVPTQVTVSPKPATSANTATAAPGAYEVRTTDSGSIHAPAVVPVVSLPLSPKPVASAPAPAAPPVPPPASASKGLALMSLLKSGNGNSADTTQPLVTPPKPADVSASTPLSSPPAITPAAKTTASTAPASAAKANALLSILKPPTAPVSTPAPAPAPAAVTPAQVQAKNLLDLLTDPQIAASTKSKASVAAVPPGLPTTVPAPATAAPAGLTRRLDVSELLAGKAASASRPPLQDRETKDGKSRSSSFGNDLVNNANTGSTPLKTAEALLLRRDKERSNSNTSLSSVGDSGANTFAQESSSRKEVLKNFLISPSMLEG